MPENENPLHLPKGSVRALVALVIVVASVTYLFVNKELPTGLVGVLGAVIGFYFGQKVAAE